MYGENWDKYYDQTYRVLKKKALWDVPVDEAVKLDQAIFEKYFDKTLPLVDLGCGTGTQSVYLASQYSKVLGVDVAKNAIKVAIESFPNQPNVSFDVLDGTDFKKAKEIHNQIGDSNIYMRGVLHQIKDEHIEAFRKTLKTLMGDSGMLYCIEVSDRIRSYFDNANENFSKLPKRMQQVFISNLPPKGLSLENLTQYFPDDLFEIKQSGLSHLNTNIKFAKNNSINIPAVYALIKQLK